jgi:O-antigen/teichoic acid export membrane protein
MPSGSSRVASLSIVNQSILTRISAIVDKLRNSVLFRRIGLLSFGVAVGQALTILISPLLTRLFTPQDFAIFGFFNSVALLLGGVATMRFDQGIVLARSSGMAAATFLLSFGACLFFTILLSLFLVLGGASLLERWVGMDGFASTALLLPLQVLAVGLYWVASQWAIRQKQFLDLSKYQIGRTVLVIGFQLLVAASVWGGWGLSLGQSIGLLLAAMWLFARGLKRDSKAILRALRIGKIRLAISRFAYLPQFTILQELISALSQPAILLILSHLQGTTLVGQFVLAQRVLQQPINFLGQSLQQTYIRHLADLTHQNKDIFRPMLRASAFLLVPSAMLIIILFLFGHGLFSFAFGTNWAMAGTYAGWMAFPMAAMLVNVPTWCGLHAMAMQKQILYWDILIFTGQCLTLWGIGQIGSIELAIACFSLVTASLFIARMGYSLDAARKHSFGMA